MRKRVGQADQEDVTADDKSKFMLCNARSACTCVEQPRERQTDQAEEGRLHWGQIEDGFVDEKEISIEIVNDHDEHETRQPGRVSLPFEPCQLVGHVFGRHQELQDSIEAASVNLPSLAGDAFRQVFTGLEAQMEMDEIE